MTNEQPLCNNNVTPRRRRRLFLVTTSTSIQERMDLRSRLRELFLVRLRLCSNRLLLLLETDFT
jgi:hypothetical protein